MDISPIVVLLLINFARILFNRMSAPYLISILG